MKLEIKRLVQPILKSFCLGSRCSTTELENLVFSNRDHSGQYFFSAIFKFSPIEGKKKIDKKLKTVKKLWLDEGKI